MTTQQKTTLVCSGCGAPSTLTSSDGRTQCPYCGRVEILNNPLPRATVTIPASGPTAAPTLQPEPVLVSKKKKSVALLFSFFFGWLAVDRFYLGYIGTGILKAFLGLAFLGFLSDDKLKPQDKPTAGFVALVVLSWWIVDIIRIAINNLKDKKKYRLS